MKTTVASMITRIKRQIDYNITDTDLDALVVDKMNNNLKLMKQWLMDNGLFRECSKSTSFKTVENQVYVDLTNARIVGNVATFTAVAGDKITVTIDGTAYTTAALTGAILVSTVVTAINLATLAIGDVASESDDGYLVITSPTSGLTSSVTIADNVGTPASRLFTVAAERTQSSIYDIDEIISLTERTNDKVIYEIDSNEFKESYPDPTAQYTSTPDYFTRLVERLYFGPTPSDNILIYIDYIFNIIEITSASTLPFQNKYDPLLEALCVLQMSSWLEPDNRARLTTCEGQVKFWYETLIEKASKNIYAIKSMPSRKPEIYPAPRKVIE